MLNLRRPQKSEMNDLKHWALKTIQAFADLIFISSD